jgi:hypothetical protein
MAIGQSASGLQNNLACLLVIFTLNVAKRNNTNFKKIKTIQEFYGLFGIYWKIRNFLVYQRKSDGKNRKRKIIESYELLCYNFHSFARAFSTT